MKITKPLQWLGLVLLVIGFAGPWVYVPVGKIGEWSWQPIWSLLISIIALNLFAIVAFASCFSYVELAYRNQEATWKAMLKWVGAFFGLLVLVPLIAWLLFDFSERTTIAQHKEGTFGWGLWLALLGQTLVVISLRLQIQILKPTKPIGDM